MLWARYNGGGQRRRAFSWENAWLYTPGTCPNTSEGAGGVVLAPRYVLCWRRRVERLRRRRWVGGSGVFRVNWIKSVVLWGIRPTLRGKLGSSITIGGRPYQ